MSKLIPWSRRRTVAEDCAVFVGVLVGVLVGAGHAAGAAPPPNAPGSVLPTSSRTASATGDSALLRKLVEASEGRPLTATMAATALLEAGPEATAQLLAELDDPQLAVGTATRLLPAQRQRVRRALDGVPSVLVGIATLDKLTPAQRSVAYSVALEILAVTPIDTTVPLLARLLEAGAVRRLPSAVVARVETTVTRIAEDPSLTSAQLALWIRSAGTELGAAVVNGAEGARALMKLVGCLGAATGAEGIILNRIAGMIQRGAPVLPEVTSAAVLPFLVSPQTFERSEASAVIGMVGDRRHVAALISALDDSESIVRSAALKALKSLTGMTISGDPSRWNQWYADQEAWWEGEGSVLVASITTANRRDLISILKEVSTRRLYRREIGSRLVKLLHRSRADEVRVAVASLATLRDPSTLEPILELRRHPNPLVRSSVEDAVVAFRHAGIKTSRVNALPSY